MVGPGGSGGNTNQSFAPITPVVTNASGAVPTVIIQPATSPLITATPTVAPSAPPGSTAISCSRLGFTPGTRPPGFMTPGAGPSIFATPANNSPKGGTVIQMCHHRHHLGYADREPKPKGNSDLLELKLTEGMDPHSSVHWEGERRDEAAVWRMPWVAARGWGKKMIGFFITNRSF